MSLPFVSVIIPTRNGGAFLVQAILSVLADDYAAKEIVVVDDGSTDDTLSMVAVFGSTVRLIRQENRGVAAARNAAIAASSGELIALLDHDDLWLPGKLSAQVPLLENDQSTVAVFSAIEFFESSTGRITAKYFPGETVNFHQLLGHIVLPVQTLLMRRKSVVASGGFSESLPLTCDWDLSVRLAQLGSIRGLPTVHGKVRIHPQQQGRNARGMYRQQMEVVRRHKDFHNECRACRDAARASRVLIREDYYAKLKESAIDYKSQGRWCWAAMALFKALIHNPIAIPRVIGAKLGI